MRSAVLFFCFVFAWQSTVDAARQVVEKSQASAIAENISVLGNVYIEDDDPLREEWDKQVREIHLGFTALTLDLIKREADRQREVDVAIWWTNLGGHVAAIFAHLFLLLGVILGSSELRRAYALRRKGANEPVEIQIGLEGAAIKSTMYGFLVFGASLVVYFGYLQYVYPLESVG